MFFITETWLSKYDSAAIASFLPSTHEFHHFPRENQQGGGIGVAVNKQINSIKSNNHKYMKFCVIY